jgi:hypothetical protein
MGLVIQKIEPCGRVFLDGRLKVGDLIIQINKKSLIGLDFDHAQEILKEAIQHLNSGYCADLEFKVVRKINSNQFYESNDDESSLLNEKESISQTITNDCNINGNEETLSPQNSYQNHIQQYSNNVTAAQLPRELHKGEDNEFENNKNETSSKMNINQPLSAQMQKKKKSAVLSERNLNELNLVHNDQEKLFTNKTKDSKLSLKHSTLKRISIFKRFQN